MEERITAFCDGLSPRADSVQVMAYGMDGLVTDIAEYRLDEWDAADVAGALAEWVAERPAASYELTSLRMTGERVGPDECWESLAVARIPSPGIGIQQLICAAIRRREAERREQDRQG